MQKPRAFISETIAQKKAEITSLLTEIVNTNSYSHNPEGINRVGEIVRRAMPSGFQHETLTNPAGVNHHVYRHPVGDRLPIILAGHLDTLCPPDPAFNKLRDEGDILRGPGVNDMKGGDVALIWALKILDLHGQLSDLPIACIFNGDEEIGSPTSHPIFTEWRNRAAMALVYECGGPEDTVVTTRKGVARYRMHIKGVPAHFGNLKKPKTSAVQELAHKILAVEAMNTPDGSVVANAGRAQGGLGANAVAAEATLDFEARYWDPAREPEVLQCIESLAADNKVPGCSTALQRLSYRPPMQPTAESRRIFDTIVARGATLGMKIIEEKRGGVSDACWLAHADIPVIDGLGPLGDHDFTPQEYIRKDTLFSRIELTANLLLDLLNN